MDEIAGAVVVAAAPLREEAVEQYTGKWVAIRDGRVVASAETFEELVEKSDVRDEDVLYRVPDRDMYFL